MSEQAPEAPVVTQEAPQQVTEQTGNPWDNYLTDLPDSVKPLVGPIFKQWDADVTKRFQSVHSEYEPLKPYQQIQEAGWAPDDIQQALQLASALNENPEAIYNALVENYGYGKQQEQGQADPEGFTDPEVDPRFAQLEQMTTQIADFIVAQEQQKQQASEDAALDNHLAQLKATHGDYDTDYVLTKMHSGMSGEDAVKAYQALVAPQRPNVPVIMGSGGGLPSQSVNPAQMTDRDRKALITQMLAQANQT